MDSVPVAAPGQALTPPRSPSSSCGRPAGGELEGLVAGWPSRALLSTLSQATAHRAGSECAATEASALCFGERAGRVTRRRLATRPRSVPGGRSLVPGVSRQRAWELVSSKRCRQGDPGAGGSALTTCGGHSVLQGDWLLPEKALRLLRGEGSRGEAICMLFAWASLDVQRL